MGMAGWKKISTEAINPIFRRAKESGGIFLVVTIFIMLVMIFFMFTIFIMNMFFPSLFFMSLGHVQLFFPILRIKNRGIIAAVKIGIGLCKKMIRKQPTAVTD